MAQVEQYLS